jgi:hypothetical protein
MHKFAPLVFLGIVRVIGLGDFSPTYWTIVFFGQFFVNFLLNSPNFFCTYLFLPRYSKCCALILTYVPKMRRATFWANIFTSPSGHPGYSYSFKFENCSRQSRRREWLWMGKACPCLPNEWENSDDFIHH